MYCILSNKMTNLVNWLFSYHWEIATIQKDPWWINDTTSDSNSLYMSILDLYIIPVAITSKLMRVEQGSVGRFAKNDLLTRIFQKILKYIFMYFYYISVYSCITLNVAFINNAIKLFFSVSSCYYLEKFNSFQYLWLR